MFLFLSSDWNSGYLFVSTLKKQPVHIIKSYLPMKILLKVIIQMFEAAKRFFIKLKQLYHDESRLADASASCWMSCRVHSPSPVRRLQAPEGPAGQKQALAWHTEGTLGAWFFKSATEKYLRLFARGSVTPLISRMVILL